MKFEILVPFLYVLRSFGDDGAYVVIIQRVVDHFSASAEFDQLGSF